MCLLILFKEFHQKTPCFDAFLDKYNVQCCYIHSNLTPVKESHSQLMQFQHYLLLPLDVIRSEANYMLSSNVY